MKPSAVLLFAAMALVLAARPVRAAGDRLDIDAWQRIPVQHNGRVMPMDTFARNLLLSFSGKSTFERKPAALWLARVFFTPDDTREDQIFLINNPEVLEALGLEAAGRGRFSAEQLEPKMSELMRLARAAFHMDEKERTPVDVELMRLFNNVTFYLRLGQGLGVVLPQEGLRVQDQQLRKDLKLAEGGSPSVVDILELAARTAPDNTDAGAQELSRLAAGVRMMSQRHTGDLPSILPPADKGEEQWKSAWDAASSVEGAREYAKELSALREMAAALRDDRHDAFGEASGRLAGLLDGRIADAKKSKRIGMEVSFNRTDPFYRSEMFYGLAFLAAMLSVPVRKRWLYRIAAGLTVIALLPHTYGIVARMFIMGRPPVTNLYTTFIFVGWTSVLLGLAMEYFQRNRLGLIVAAASGLALLLTAGRFADGDDTMGVMIAVLDSNFWLATHVVTISMGYAGCCAAGLLGHIYLLQAFRYAPDEPVLIETHRAVFGLQAFGLIFSFVGTMLGGVWADQSWGRFWGWDPKENGALVIVLWSAALFHARACGLIANRGFAAGSVLGIIWVMLAWMGVNLLGVGLHSYGFTSGVARGLLIACGAEVLFVAATVPFARAKKLSAEEAGKTGDAAPSPG